MPKVVKDILILFSGVVFSGLLLDEAGKGTFGNIPQTLAKKVSNGFGV